MGCPLEACWTGAATVSFARKMREDAHVSTALYLPGAPCHTCAHLVEDEVVVPAPRAPGARRHDAAATLQRVTCGQGLWLHPISLASFVMRTPAPNSAATRHCSPKSEPCSGGACPPVQR